MQRLLIDRGHVAPLSLAPALEALHAGELVVVPTEAVYMLATRADRAQRLHAATADVSRQTGRTAPWLWLGTPEMIAESFPPLPEPARRLAQRYWPGPLAIHIAARPDLPDAMAPAEPVMRALLDAVQTPLLALPIAFSGWPAATDGVLAKTQIRSLVRSEVAVLVDTGPTAYQAEPTRLAVSAFGLRVMRNGPLSLRHARELATVRICFVCTGNICRSPLAAALMLALAERDAQRALGSPYELALEVSSCGTAGLSGHPATPETVELARRYGAGDRITAHVAARLTHEHIAAADLVLVAAREHRDAILRLDAAWEPKVHLIDPGGAPIRDPYGQSPRVYEASATAILRALRARFFSGAADA